MTATRLMDAIQLDNPAEIHQQEYIIHYEHTGGIRQSSNRLVKACRKGMERLPRGTRKHPNPWYGKEKHTGPTAQH
jgi:hypothetical protein